MTIDTAFSVEKGATRLEISHHDIKSQSLVHAATAWRYAMPTGKFILRRNVIFRNTESAKMRRP